MAGIGVNVKPEIIEWILQRVQFDNIADSAIEMLNKWRTGEKTPTFNQVEAMSKKTSIPFGYFFLDEPPVEECHIVDYRTVNSAAIPEPSRNLLDTLDLMTDIQEWMADYVIENGQDALAYVGSAKDNESVARIVSEIRRTLGIEEDWYAACKSVSDALGFYKNRIEDIGVLVMMSGIVGNNTRRKLNVNEFRAFTLVNPYVPLIFINTCDSEAGKLFSLLHELAHIWIGMDSLYNEQASFLDLGNAIEKKCNAVAAEILVPQNRFIEKWEHMQGDYLDKVEALAKTFKCSRYVIARRALDTDKISKTSYERIIDMLAEQFKEWKRKQKSSGGDFYKTLGSRNDRRLIAALANSAKSGRIQYSEAYRLTNTNRKTFDNLLSKIGGAAW